MSEQPIVAVEDVHVAYSVSARTWGARREVLVALSGVSVEIERRETLALVGESGCGKTTLGRTILRLIVPTSGRVVFDGTDIAGLRGAALRGFRRSVQTIFQDPYSSLNPRMTVGDIVAEPLRANGVQGSEREARVAELLEMVGLPPAARLRFPNAFSGGQRQRIGIARALALQPALLIADEPVSALDVSIQAQIINLLSDLKDTLGLTVLIISHDLAVVRHMADHVAVMYLGQIVEFGTRAAIFGQPLHPYTLALLSAVVAADGNGSQRRLRVSGEPPSPVRPPSGCRFHPRCPFAQPICATEAPELRTVNGRLVACHFAGEVG